MRSCEMSFEETRPKVRKESDLALLFPQKCSYVHLRRPRVFLGGASFLSGREFLELE